MTNVELLRQEIDTQWTRGERGRLARVREPDGAPAPDVVLGVADDGSCLAIGSEVDDRVADRLESSCRDGTPQPDPAQPPSVVSKAYDILRGSLGAVELSSGPCYVFPPSTSFASPAVIIRSADEDSSRVGDDSPPGLAWSRGGWRSLLAGERGPWAMASVDGRVVAVCHSARLFEAGAEAGVWTHPDFRGRGHAAAVSAAWASLVAASGREPFYSTSADNRSSQRVAARLGLRPIGWLWEVSRVASAETATGTESGAE